MKYVILFLMVKVAWAEEVPKSETFNDSVAKIEVVFTENDEPVFAPIGLEIKLTCKDLRKTPSSATPKTQVISTHAQICETDKPSFDTKEKVLKLHYFTSRPSEETGEAECENEVDFAADIKILCQGWGA